MAKANKLLRKSEVFEGSGPLREVADQATAAGFRYFTLNGKLFEVMSGRVAGSSLGVHSIKGAQVIE